MSQQLSRGIGIYVIAFIFSLSANSDAGSWGREGWWILLLIANIPAFWLIYKVQYRQGR